MTAAILNAILRALPDSGAGMTLAELAKAVGRSRPKVSAAAARMVSRKFVERLARGRYRLGPLGVAARDAGAPVPCGPREPHTGPRKPETGSLRARVWKALRQLTKATIAELVTMAANGGERDAEQNAEALIYALCKAGVVVAMKRRDPDRRVRYFLKRDLGPLPPVVRQARGKEGQVWDPNARKVIATVPAPRRRDDCVGPNPRHAWRKTEKGHFACARCGKPRPVRKARAVTS